MTGVDDQTRTREGLGLGVGEALMLPIVQTPGVK